MKKMIISLLLFVAALAAAPCYAAASPEPSDRTIPREIKIGKKGAEAVEKQIPRVLDPAVEARLAMITDRLTPFLKRDLEYGVRILDMKEPNAFALPGGRTYITTGMLDFLKSEDEIAAILCHEFIHADRAHGIVQAKRNSKLNLLSIAALIAATQAGGEAAAGLASMAGGISTAISNSYSIELEKEADAMGIDVLRRAGYNPAAMLTTMERLRVEKLKRAQYELGIFQTHPEEEERVDAALKYCRDHGIEVQRKDVVQSLKVTTDTVSGDVRLRVDGAVLVTAKESPESSKLFDELAKRLDSTLELELAPYDIQVLGDIGSRSLVIKRKTILTDAERLKGMPALQELRDRINDALIKARRGNPIVDYFN